MSKDFTDYNGPKRKAILYPPKDRPTRKLIAHKSEKKVGFKTKVDRLRSAIQELVELKEDRRFAWKRYRKTGKKEHIFWPDLKWGRWHIDKIRKLKKEYTQEGIYEKLLETIRNQGWPKPVNKIWRHD